MNSDLKEKVSYEFQEHIVKRRAMFIPMICISTFALVGYAASDREAPVIESNKIQVLYGTELDKNAFAITDNRDSLDALNVEIDTKSFDANQLGNYTVEVSATDSFSNSTTKKVDVEVIDNVSPEITAVAKSSGYVIDVEAGESSDINKYIKAVDNVDGDVTPFIETSKKLNTKSLGIQTIDLNVSDTSGNKATQTYDFYVSDSAAPEITLTKGKTATVNYGSTFNIKDIVKVYDKYDGSNVALKVDGDVDTKKEGTYDLKLTAIDSSDNQSVSAVSVKVADISAPDLKLKKSSVKIKTGSSINLKSYIASAKDNKDGDCSDDVKISGSVDKNKAGNYTIKYTVTDKAGNSVTKSLKVTVYKPSVNAGDDLPANSGIASTASSRRGCRYVMGGSGPSAFDCSGLAQWAYAKNGISIPRTTNGQYAATSRVSKSQLQPGDLVFFSGTTSQGGITHVGIYIGGGKMVHAANYNVGVIVSSIYSSYWSSHYAGAGRK